MSQAQSGSTVRVHYTGKLQDGTVFDSSKDRDPLEFTIGNGEVISGFEQAVEGMAPGETKTETIEAQSAYGPFRNELVQEVQRTEFPEDVPLEEGRRYRISEPGRDPIVVTVAKVTDEAVVIDANHPLAGQDLVFDIQLEEIVT